MKNILVVGGSKEDRLQYALQSITSIICISKNKPCNNCTHCTRVINNTHPNVFFIRPIINEHGAQELIKIEQIRAILLEQHKQSFEDTVTFFVIEEINHITKQAANALLKALEETQKQKMFIALASSKMSVLATIRSRLIIQFLKPLLDKYKNKNTEKLIHTLCSTPLNKRYDLLSDFPQEKSSALTFLLEIKQTLHGFLKEQDNNLPYLVILKISESLDKSIESLEKNLNVRLVIEVLLLKMWPYYPQIIK